MNWDAISAISDAVSMLAVVGSVIYLMSCMRFREYVWRQYNEGLIEKQTFEDYLRVITYELGTERNRRWWASAKRFGFNQGFIDFVDGRLRDSPLIDVEKQLLEW